VTRLPLKQDDQLDAATRELFAAIRARGGEVPDLYRLLANVPELLKAWTDLAWPLRNVQCADRSLRELLIMRTAQLTGAKYEWAHHWNMALDTGVKEKQLAALEHWRDSDCFSAAERAALAMTDEIVSGAHMPDAVFRELRAHFADAAIVQVVLTVSFYCCVARFAGGLALDVEAKYAGVPSMTARERR
jgi:alkylhydroperoxidase family enzyme